MQKSCIFLLISLYFHFGFSQCGTISNDCDGDGIINSIDLDDDNDGILDIHEAEGKNCGLMSDLEPSDFSKDFFAASFHAHFVNISGDTPLVTGDSAAPNGSSDVMTYIEVTPANGYTYSGIAIKGLVVGERSQFALLTTAGIYIWGEQGKMIPTPLTSSKSIQNLPLPFGILPSDIKDIAAGHGTLAIITNTGELYTITNNDYMSGDGTFPPDNNWHQVMINATTPLTNVIHYEIGDEGAFVITATNDWYTWGNDMYLGNGAGTADYDFATVMNKPTSFTSVNDVKMISYTSTNSSSRYPSYYVLHAGEEKLYSLGENSSGQLGIGNFVNQNNWQIVQNKTGTGDLTNVKFVDANSGDDKYAGAGVIVDEAGCGYEILLFGQSDSNSLSDAATYNNSLPFTPSYNTTSGGYVDVNSDGTINCNDRKPVVFHIGEHFSLYYDAAQGKYGYSIIHTKLMQQVVMETTLIAFKT
jgi:hypothetical protein